MSNENSIKNEKNEEIKEFGSVQRAMLGISMQEMTDRLAESVGMKGEFFGVYVHDTESGGAADLSGIKAGDVIMSIDSCVVANPSDIQEKINSFRPGEEIMVSIFRKGERIDCKVVLQGRDKGVKVGADGERIELFGALLEKAPQTVLKKLRLKSGVQIASLEKGKFKDAGIKEKLIITHVNQVPVSTPDEVVQLVGRARRSVLIEGVYPNGAVYYYGVGV